MSVASPIYLLGLLALPLVALAYAVARRRRRRATAYASPTSGIASSASR